MPPPPRGRSRPGDQLEPAPDPRTQYEFPRMPFVEIQEDMNLYNCPVTKEMLRDPSPTDTKAILDFFISEVYNKRPEDMAQQAFGCLDDVEYPELYEDSIPRLHFFRECQKMFSAAHFDEFQIRDVFAPSKARFSWQISALINFNKFRQTRLSSFEEMANNADELLQRERAILSAKAQLQKEIDGIEEVRAGEEVEVERIRDLVSELTLEINALHNQQRTLTDQTREAKLAMTDKAEKATALKMKKMTAREEVEKMRSRVVSSPDRVKGEMDEMRKTLGLAKEEVQSMEKRTRGLLNRLKGLTRAADSAKEACTAVEECLASKERTEDLQRALRESKNKKAAYDAEVESTKKSREYLERLVDSVASKVARMDEQYREIASNSSENDKKLAERNRQLHAEQEQVARILKEKELLARSYNDEIEQCVTRFADEVERVAERQEHVGEKFTAYHTDLTKAAIIVGESSQQSMEDCKKALQEGTALAK